MPEQEFDRFLKSLGPMIKKGLLQIPGAIKVIGIEFIHDNFAKQGFEESPGSVRPWPKRKQALAKTKTEQKKRRQGRAILVNKGFLRRSWAADSKKTKDSVVFTSHLPYAEVHNEGLRAGRGSGFMMPERKMIGDSQALEQQVRGEVDRIISDNLKQP